MRSSSGAASGPALLSMLSVNPQTSNVRGSETPTVKAIAFDGALQGGAGLHDGDSSCILLYLSPCYLASGISQQVLPYTVTAQRPRALNDWHRPWTLRPAIAVCARCQRIPSSECSIESTVLSRSLSSNLFSCQRQRVDHCAIAKVALGSVSGLERIRAWSFGI